MKRKLLHAVLVASMAVALSGCGNTSGINADAEETQKATETENIEEERGTEVAAAEQKENTTRKSNFCAVFGTEPFDIFFCFRRSRNLFWIFLFFPLLNVNRHNTQFQQGINHKQPVTAPSLRCSETFPSVTISNTKQSHGPGSF